MGYQIDPGLMLGAVTLSVADLSRSTAYYQQVIGLKILSQSEGQATLGVEGRRLLRLHQQPGAKLMRRATGLYHFALRVPTRRDLAGVIRHLAETNSGIDGAADHLVSEALYLSDPDGHGIEIYRDRPREKWVDDQGKFKMGTYQLDFQGILGELNGQTPAWEGLPAGSDMGHIHLQVADLASAVRFYTEALGMDRMMGIPSASFVSAGGYHHHIGLNTWAGVGVPTPPADAARLLSYELLFTSSKSLAEALIQLEKADVPAVGHNGGWQIHDPSGNLIRLRAL